MSQLLKREWLGFMSALLILLGVAAVCYKCAITAEVLLTSVEHTGEVLAWISTDRN